MDYDENAKTVSTNTKVSGKFPKIVYLIVFTELCERFTYSGMRAFLALYLKQRLNFSDQNATELYHIFSTLAYVFPVCGAIIADSFLGRYKTILYLMFVYAAGNICVFLASTPIGLPQRLFTAFGLLLIALGTGGIKPCVAAFGGDQFQLPEQEKQLTIFFVYYYFAICIGSLAAKTSGPLLRSEFACFGAKDCYSLAFGAPGILMIMSIIIFVSAKRFYILKKPSGNVVLKSVTCIYTATKKSFKRSGLYRAHWLDAAADRHGTDFVKELKGALNVLTLFLPLPFFWSLLDQLGSRWTFQASKMNGDFGYFSVRPDQISLVNPVIILLTIPLFQEFVYPLLAKCNILVKPYPRMIAGFLLVVLSFVCSGFVEMSLQKTQPLQPGLGSAQLRLYNVLSCDMHVQTQQESFILRPLEFRAKYFTGLKRYERVQWDVQTECGEYQKKFQLFAQETKAMMYVHGGPQYPHVMSKYLDNVSKSRTGYPMLRFVTNLGNNSHDIYLYNEMRNNVEINLNPMTVSRLHEVFASNYTLYVNGEPVLSKIKLLVGGVYTLAININEHNQTVAKLLEITAPNSMSMAWLLPQLWLSSLGEVMFAVTGQEFAFKAAPGSMKSLMQAGWLLTEAVGNIIIIFGSRIAGKYSQANQTFAYAGVATIAILVFYFMARKYERRIVEERAEEITVEQVHLKVEEASKDCIET